ncbi:MAG: hypothetical protein U9Q12_00750 [Patescibacteria group bacterium]|nr:hypothetical protein [Patescibacteria group bacterium]
MNNNIFLVAVVVFCMFLGGCAKNPQQVSEEWDSRVKAVAIQQANDTIEKLKNGE